MKKIDEDKIIDFLAVITIIVLAGLIWWLIEWAKPFEIPKTEETTQIVENSVESVQKLIVEEKPQYIEMEVTATAYCPCIKCCGKSDGITATGTRATPNRTLAVDPQIIPYGTKVIIDGQTYIAEDKGGAIKENRIDIYFESHNEALNFGRQTKTIKVIL